MTYKIVKTIEDMSSERDRAHVAILETDNQHLAVDFESQQYVFVNRWRFESGWTDVDGQRVEVTRVLASCEKDHGHGVYYQAPRHMEIWEAMFALGESPENGVSETDLFKSKDGDNDGTVPNDSGQ